MGYQVSAGSARELFAVIWMNPGSRVRERWKWGCWSSAGSPCSASWPPSTPLIGWWLYLLWHISQRDAI